MAETSSQFCAVGLNRRLALLRRAGREARVSTLIAALPLAGPGEIEPMAAELLDAMVQGLCPIDTKSPGRRDEPLDAERRAVASLLAVWDRLPEAARAAFIAAAPRLGRSLTAIAESPAPEIRGGLIAFASEARDGALLPLLVRLAGDEQPGTARAAARAVRTIMARRGPAPLGASDEQALVSAAEAYPNHRRLGVMAAVASALDPACTNDPERHPLGAWFAGAGKAAIQGLADALSRDRDLTLTLRAFEWLADGRLADASLERLATAHLAEDLALILERSHLALRPARSCRLGRVLRRAGRPVGETAPLVPTPGMVSAMGCQARRGLVRWLDAIGAPAAVRDGMLRAALSDPDALVRHWAVRAAGPGTLTDLVFNPHPCVARSALLRMVCPAKHTAAEALHPALERHPDPIVRLLSHRARTRDGHRAARRGPPDACDRLVLDTSAQIDAGDDAGAACSLMVIRRLRLHERAKQLLIRAAGEVHARESEAAERLRATAFAALGEMDDDEARAAAYRGLSSRVDRVRANALESLLRHARAGGDLAGADPLLYGAAMELKSDPCHRVRANAVRGLIQAAAGASALDSSPAEELGRLLCDPRPMHRLAGAWAAQSVLIGAERTPLVARRAGFVGQLSELAARDGDGRVRRRAAACLGRFRAVERTRWTMEARAGGAGDA